MINRFFRIKQSGKGTTADIIVHTGELQRRLSQARAHYADALERVRSIIPDISVVGTSVLTPTDDVTVMVEHPTMKDSGVRVMFSVKSESIKPDEFRRILLANHFLEQNDAFELVQR